MNFEWLIRRSAGLLLLSMVWWSLAARAEGTSACTAPEPELAQTAVERWMDRHVPPVLLLDALARYSSWVAWIDEVAISAGRGLVKGHVEHGERKEVLAALVQDLQRQSDAVRRPLNAIWLDGSGVPNADPVTPKFLVHFEGLTPLGRAAGRSAISCEMVGSVLTDIVGLAVMNGRIFQRFAPRRDISTEDGLPVLSIDANWSGTFAELRRLLLNLEGLPYLVAVDGVVVTVAKGQLSVGLTIKLLRGAGRVGGVFAQRAVLGGALPDPFRAALR